MTRLQIKSLSLGFAVLLGAGAATVFTVAGAAAQTGGNLQQQAASLASQISATGTKLQAVDEQLNGAQLQLQQANATITDADTRIAAAKAQADTLQQLVEQRAVSIYQAATTGSDTSLFNVDPSELASSQQYTQAASDQDNALVDQLNEARAELRTRETEAQSAKSQAEKAVAGLQAAQASLSATQAQFQALNNQVQGQLVSLVAQNQASALAASQGAPGRLTGGPSGPPPAVSPGAAGAVEWAKSQVGKPYCTGGAGPSCYDCSGLTMAAWGAAGVGMPHFSGAQYDDFPHVAMSQLQPGDLVFPSDPGSHVALYAGGGMIVEATVPGDTVHYWPIRSDFVLAARP